MKTFSQSLIAALLLLVAISAHALDNVRRTNEVTSISVDKLAYAQDEDIVIMILEPRRLIGGLDLLGVHASRRHRPRNGAVLAVAHAARPLPAARPSGRPRAFPPRRSLSPRRRRRSFPPPSSHRPPRYLAARPPPRAPPAAGSGPGPGRRR